MVRSGALLIVVMPSVRTSAGSRGSACADPVLNQLLRLVRIGAEPERDVERHQSVGGGLAAHVEHALDAR